MSSSGFGMAKRQREAGLSDAVPPPAKARKYELKDGFEKVVKYTKMLGDTGDFESSATLLQLLRRTLSLLRETRKSLELEYHGGRKEGFLASAGVMEILEVCGWEEPFSGASEIAKGDQIEGTDSNSTAKVVRLVLLPSPKLRINIQRTIDLLSKIMDTCTTAGAESETGVESETNEMLANSGESKHADSASVPSSSTEKGPPQPQPQPPKHPTKPEPKELEQSKKPGDSDPSGTQNSSDSQSTGTGNQKQKQNNNNQWYRISRSKLKLVVRVYQPENISAPNNNKGPSSKNMDVDKLELDSKYSKYNEAISAALKACREGNKDLKVARSMLRAILQILKKIKKRPSDVRHRRLLCSSVVYRKFVAGPKGGEELMRSCGFTKENLAGKGAVVMQRVEPDRLHSALVLVKSALSALSALSENSNTNDSTNDNSNDNNSANKPKKKSVMCPCGYWGSTDTDGLCSVCFKKKTFGIAASGAGKSEKGKTERESKSQSRGDAASRWKAAFKRARLRLRAVTRFRKGLKSQKAQQNKSRCYQCNKKVGILGFECRCMFVFCDKHRFPDAHRCKFDYKRQHRNKLKKDNQALSQKKMTKID
eukprot:CAMPEP_0197530456 /NCGR_PEP_ID=MMETSP1318-20131121/31941_1 /TAXON_ID=552666 /ORGANISM="Partenskyella glossopodia, Strain RCC365" /LENGTH=594 /DNA_ID=CAMNT_0043086311 /DNA_START=73 /DNA_END=1857 /DNA_ORIENTATION=+